MGEYKIGTTVFDGWEIVRQLGEGAFGKVFEVQKNAGGIVTRSALKVIRIPRSLSDYKDILSEGMDEKSATSYFQGIVTQLLKEIALMSDLKGHPNIVAYEDHQVEEDPNIVGWDILIRMELLTSLDDYQIAHPMDEAAVRKLGIDLCQALAFCQRKKALIHRDVKPGNIFVNEAGQFKLGDFGIARTVEQTISGMSRQGTESYMAPEVYLDKPYGVSTDLYSLGMVLYKLMNEGRLPFLPPAPQPINFAHRENARKSRMDGKPLPPPKNASPEFAAIILKACAYAPEDRYHTAADMLDALTGKTKAPESKRPEPIEPEPKPIEPEPEPLEPEPKMPESKPEPKPKPEPEPPKPEMPESKPEPSGRNESDRTEAEKKKKIILIGGGILALLLVIGCVLWGTGQKQNTADSTVQADTDDTIVSTDSDAEEFYTNTVSAMGYDSYVTVTMTYDYDSDSIIDVEIDVSGETDGIGADIGDEMAARILEAQSADVDAVSGATVTSEAVKDAADYCLFLFYAGLDSVTETLETDNDDDLQETVTETTGGVLREGNYSTIDDNGYSLDGVTTRNSITEVYFLDTLTDAPEDAKDLSEAQDDSVLCWTEGSTQYIAAEGGVKGGSDCSSLFNYYTALTTVEFAGNFDTSNVTDMSYMFWECASLTSLDLSGWDTSSVTDMGYMFFQCNSLISLDLSDWDVSNVTDMGGIFDGCASLTSLDLSGWDTSGVTDMSYMFWECESLTSLDLSGWDTSNVTDMGYMFYQCTSLTDFNPDWINTATAASTTNVSYNNNNGIYEMYSGTIWEE